MSTKKRVTSCKKAVERSRRAKGVLNKVINNLPVELHIPGYQYCGPGTKLTKRLAQGDPGINPLDKACKEHDIVYFQNNENITARNIADIGLAEKSWNRVLTKDARIGEKAAAWEVSKAMKMESKLGMGVTKKKKMLGLPLKKTVSAANKSTVPGKDEHSVIKSALQSCQEGWWKKKCEQASNFTCTKKSWRLSTLSFAYFCRPECYWSISR